MKHSLAAIALGVLILNGTHVSGADTLLLRNGILHTVSGAVLTNADLLVRHGRIAALGSDLNESADHHLDLAGGHLFPGLIAATTLLGLVEVDAVRSARDSTEVGDFRPDVHSWMAVQPDSELIPVARANGFTHAQTVPMGGVVSGHSAVIALSGWTIEDLAVSRDAALHVFWPAFGLDTTPKQRAANPERWKSIEDQVKERDRRVAEIDDFFADAETYARERALARPRGTGGDGTPAGENGFAPVPAWEAMVPFVEGKIPLFIHADEIRQIRSAVEWVARRRYRAVLAGGRDAWRVAELLAKHAIPVAYEDVFTLPPRDIDPYDVQFAAPSVLARAGVRVIFAGGLDRFGASNLRNVPYAAAQAVAFGLPAAEALRGLTLYPAEILGLSGRLGSLEVGKDATFFLADGDILDLRTSVQRLWIVGREVSLESRHTRLYERYRNRPRNP